MFDPQDELQILSLIEGELSADEAEAVRARLAVDPSARAAVERMIRDRDLLRSDPEPLLPLNFIERIEPLLARPMLMDPATEEALVDAAPGARGPSSRPGEFRRKHRRQGRRRRALRWALAAGFGVAVFGGLWSMINVGLPRSWAPSFWAGGSGAETLESPAAAGEPRTPALGSGVPQHEGGVLHHIHPEAGFDRLAHADPTPDAPGQASAEPRDAQLALVIQTSEATDAEAMMERLLAGFDDRIALVRNFSYAEARELERQWLLARGQASPTQRAQREARIGGPDDPPRSRRLDEMAERARQQMVDAREPAAAVSRQLLGPRELAASLGAQLDYSSRGATHTISIRAGRLEELLVAMNAAPDQRTLLQPLPEATAAETTPRNRRTPPPPSMEALWLKTLPEVQKRLAELAESDPETLVHLPVMIRTAP